MLMQFASGQDLVNCINAFYLRIFIKKSASVFWQYAIVSVPILI